MPPCCDGTGSCVKYDNCERLVSGTCSQIRDGSSAFLRRIVPTSKLFMAIDNVSLIFITLTPNRDAFAVSTWKSITGYSSRIKLSMSVIVPDSINNSVKSFASLRRVSLSGPYTSATTGRSTGGPGGISTTA